MIIDESLTPAEQLAIIRKEFGKQHLYLNAYNVNMIVRKIDSSYFAEGLIKNIDYSLDGNKNVANYKYVALHCTWNAELGTRLDFYQLHAVIDSYECITLRTDSELHTLDQRSCYLLAASGDVPPCESAYARLQRNASGRLG